MDKLKTISFPKDELGDTFRSHGLKPKTWYNIISRKVAYNDIYFKVEGIDCYIPINSIIIYHCFCFEFKNFMLSL